MLVLDMKTDQKQVNEPDLREVVHDLSNAMVSLKSIVNKIGSTGSLDEAHSSAKSALERIALTESYLSAVKNVEANILDHDIGELLKNQMKFFRASYDQVDISLSVNSRVRKTLQTGLLFNALTNLIKNSIEAGATKIHIEVTDESLHFIDNGRGLSKEDLLKLKEIGSTKGEGRGVGLFSVAKFCRRCGWRIHLQNNGPKEHFPSGLKVSFQWNF